MGNVITVEDFEGGVVPAVKWPGIKHDLNRVQQIKTLIGTGKLHCPGMANPDPVIDLLFPKPVEPSPEVKSSWPFLCGRMARRAKLKNTVEVHGLAIGSGSHRRWTAGWEWGGRDEPRKAESGKPTARATSGGSVQ